MDDVYKAIFVGISIGVWLSIIVVTYTGSCG